MSTPLVAVPAVYLDAGRVSGWTDASHAVPDKYVAALSRAGARPVLLPAPDPAPASEILAPFDALVLIGGGDVEAHRYGGRPHPAEYLEPSRDELELSLAKEALRTGLPTLAICRGVQVLNVAVGGSLHQHLPDMAWLTEHGQAPVGDAVDHPVRVAPGTTLAGICGPALDSCNSQHHQGIDRLGAGLAAVGWSEDGLVEAVEAIGPTGADGGRWRWALGVQWHPERTAATDPTQQALFDALVDRARADGSRHG
ncbi:MAG TPA: gamma-glutamyl-gamma-aminobutyrate hydrolase family protein [Acidimicrobiales bacterium]|nr:gamma-glutamyl-gamma-aminobutyrate hydrolase family protein [Acidimicrobiales bacterium]